MALLRRDGGGARGQRWIVPSLENLTQASGQREAEKKICDHEEYEGYEITKCVSVSAPSKMEAARTYDDKVGPAGPDRWRDGGAMGRRCAAFGDQHNSLTGQSIGRNCCVGRFGSVQSTHTNDRENQQCSRHRDSPRVLSTAQASRPFEIGWDFKPAVKLKPYRSINRRNAPLAPIVGRLGIGW